MKWLNGKSSWLIVGIVLVACATPSYAHKQVVVIPLLSDPDSVSSAASNIILVSKKMVILTTSILP